MTSDCFSFEGICFTKTFHNIEDLRVIRDEFVVRDGDVIIVSYPKSGTNWMIEIVSLIHSNGDPSWVQSVVNWERSPWLEVLHNHVRIETQKDPRFYTSHLPIQVFPKSFFKSKAKVIYIIRNPRDVITSGFYFCKIMKTIHCPETFDKYVEGFLHENQVCGSWFDHIRGWLQMREKENILIISYEDLQKDIRAGVERICRFLGKKLGPEELNSVLKHVSFEVMKMNKMSNLSQQPDEYMDHSKGNLMRKGIVGDWKHHFTVAQSEAFDKVYQEKMAGLPQGLFPWPP